MNVISYISNSIQSIHTIVMFHNNTKFLPNTCKNQQCTHELSGNLRMKEMKDHSFMHETKRDDN